MVKSFSLKNKFLTGLLAAACWPYAHRLVSLLYARLNRFLPVDRLADNAHWVAIYHPRPEYPLHILILPNHAIPSLTGAPNDHPALYADLFTLVQQLIEDFQLDQQRYRLITNGGLNQSILIWHWHLVCEAICKDGEVTGVSHA